jgi:hypothetical protein
MTTKVIGLRRLAFGAAAVAVTAAVALPAFSGSASAAQVTSRYIKMSSSASGTVTAGQGVSYEIGFTIPASVTVQGIVVDFCKNTPIIGDTCTAPTGFSVGTPTVATTGGANTGLSGTWTAANGNTGRTLSITNASGAAISGAVKFTLSTVTNPTHVQNDGTFYARIFTFATPAAVTTWLTTTNGSSTTGVIDSGGVALSTANQLTLTAKVQETLTFCIYTDGNTCASPGSTSLVLGDTNGVLRTGGEFVNKEATFDVATNAASGAAVRFKAGLPTSGSNTLASIDDDGVAGSTSLAGTTQFGLCAYRVSGTNLSFVAPYNNGAADGGAACLGTTDTAGTGATGGSNGAAFAFDTTAAASLYGDDLATVAAGNTAVGRIAYVGNVSTTQAAGIYANTFNFIATGTY